MKVHQIMTAHARCVGLENTLVEAAGLMRELDVGALPVCDNDRLAGMVTDRDIVLRGTAEGRDPNSTAVGDVMSPGIVYVFADQDVEEAGRIMEEKQIRRLPVLNREKRLVGIVSLGDIATTSSPTFSGMALRDVSMPHNPTARQRRLAQASRAEPLPRVRGAARIPERAPKRGGGRTESRRQQTTSRSSRSRSSSARGGRSSSTRSTKKTSRRSAPSRASRSRKSSGGATK